MVLMAMAMTGLGFDLSEGHCGWWSFFYGLWFESCLVWLTPSGDFT